MPNQAYVEYKPTAKGTHSMRQNPLAVTVWLLICCGMIFVMALLGAITRLTESGLSITEWNPVMGILPPLNAAAWQQAFAGYQEIPQYQLLHRGMTLEAFKEIYFWEWLHRLWGRLIGIAFAVFAAVAALSGESSRKPQAGVRSMSKLAGTRPPPGEGDQQRRVDSHALQKYIRVERNSRRNTMAIDRLNIMRRKSLLRDRDLVSAFYAPVADCQR